MREELLHASRAAGQMSSAALTRGMAWGSIGGLVGAIVMDLVQKRVRKLIPFIY